MGKKPFISIITLTFNHRAYIEQTIRSVLQQTYQNWEWIILDDGSTDDTGYIIKSFKDSRIRYVFQEHTGFNYLAENHNKVLNMCNGDLIAMLDSDDYWPDYKLDVQLKSFDSPEIVLSYGECCVVNQHNKRIGYMDLIEDENIATNTPIGTSLKAFLKLIDLKRYLFIHNSTVMIKKDNLIKIGGFINAPGTHQDFPTWVKLSLQGRFSAIPVCLGYWRRHPMATTYKQNQIQLFDTGINFLRDFIIQNEEKLREIGLSFDLDFLEKRWKEIREVFITYLPFNMAMLMLRLDSFNEAQRHFLNFLKEHNGLKNRLMYYLLILSSLIKFDLVSPVIDWKEKIRKGIFRANYY